MKEYDPRMHTAEHILNQTMVRMFNKGRAFSSHIEKKKSKCDYNFDRDITEAEAKEIEERVNNQIKRNLNVIEDFIKRSDAEGIFSLKRLPASAGEILRIIKVGDYDACPCSGLHVKNTQEIGDFKLISHSFDNGVLRIRFKIE